MRRLVCIGLVSFLFLASENLHCGDSYKPPLGFVPDAGTAITIAEAILVPIYGEEITHKQKPFVAILDKGIWTVTGTLPKGLKGGVALVEIARKDARIIRVIHGR